MVAPLGLAANQAEFEFEAGPYGGADLAVIAWEANEELSRLYELEIELAAADEAQIDVAEMIGKDARLDLQRRARCRSAVNDGRDEGQLQRGVCRRCARRVPRPEGQ